jgi:hypothetical protein
VPTALGELGVELTNGADLRRPGGRRPEPVVIPTRI